jgi:hypothetical protein
MMHVVNERKVRKTIMKSITADTRLHDINSPCRVRAHAMSSPKMNADRKHAQSFPPTFNSSPLMDVRASGVSVRAARLTPQMAWFPRPQRCLGMLQMRPREV